MRRLLNLILVLSAWLCITGCGKPVRNVVAVWRTAEDDLIYQEFHETIKKEFRSRGIKVRIEDCFLNDGYYAGVKLQDRLPASLDRVEADGRKVDLVMAYGDFCHHMAMLAKDPRLEDIPIVSFALLGDEINRRPEKRRVVTVRDSITLKENLDFMRFVFPDKYRVITMLDWRSSWIDRSLMNSMSGQMAALDSADYFCGLGLRCSAKDLDDAAKAGKTVFYSLSLDNTIINRNPDTDEVFPATWAFFSQRSDNHVLMVKHDKVTERLELNPDFPLYCTAVAEGFLHHDNCIGGHFSPFSVQVKDAVDRAQMLWDGVDPSDIPVAWHKRDYHADWDVLRDRMELGGMPDCVHLEGVRFSDRHPSLHAVIVRYGWLLTGAAALLLLVMLLSAAIRNALVRRELSRVSRASIELKDDLNMLLRGTNSVSWTIEDGRIVYANDGMNLKNNITLAERHTQSNDFYKEKLEHFFAISQPGSYSLQIERVDFDGKTRWYELRMNVAATIDGVRKSGITINIDDDKKMEASLHEAHRKLALANERENFISAMSHEMRTPLNSIVGFSQILTAPGYECDEEELRQFGEAIDESNHELMKIIEDMLALTHMDNSNIRIDFKEYTAADILRRFENDRAGHEHASGRTVRYHKGPENSKIRVDIGLLENAWRNIVGNALKFSDSASSVDVGWTESPVGVSLYVSDVGIGIDKANHDIIFNRFFQVDHFTQGTGLGLALAKEYVTRMGGTITVDSEPGTGSTFYIRFPMSEGDKSV